MAEKGRPKGPREHVWDATGRCKQCGGLKDWAISKYPCDGPRSYKENARHQKAFREREKAKKKAETA